MKREREENQTSGSKTAASIFGQLTAVLMVVLLFADPALADPQESSGLKSVSQTQGLSVNDPISANAGAYYFKLPLLDLGGPLPLRYVLDYRMDRYSGLWDSGIDGPFQSGLSQYLERDADGVAIVYLRNGDFPRFQHNEVAGVWSLDAASPVRYVMKETGSSWTDGYYYVMDPVREQLFIFEKIPSWNTSPDFSTVRVLAQMDRNGNRLTYTYADADALVPTQVADGLGRSLSFTYNGIRVSRIIDQSGRFASFTTGTQCFNPALESVTDPEGNTTRFTYDCTGGSLLSIAEVQHPLGNTPYGQTVDGITLDGNLFARVTSQTDAYNNATTLSYAADTNRMTESRPDGKTVTYEHYNNNGVPKSLIDAADKAAAFGQTANEQLSAITDRMGDATTLTYHTPTGKTASFTNAKNQTTTWTYTAQDQTFTNPANSEEATFTFYNLTKIDYPDGFSEQFTYDARGNILTRMDQAGNTWTYTYNNRGQILTAANPAGGITSFTYNADATLATSTDSDTGATAYSYDNYKRLNRIDYPGGAFVQMTYDLNDRLTSMTDENGNKDTFTHDANGNLIKITDPDNRETLFEYDLMDRLVKTTDRLGRETLRAYDAMNRLARITDPTGVKAVFGYDPRGWMNAVTRAGKTWTTAYDDEGVPTGRTTPLNRTTAMTTDKMGLVAKITDPLDSETRIGRDAMNRITSITDPGALITRYAYDPAGRIAGITLPDSSSVDYLYDTLGLLQKIRDFNDAEWTFTHTSMGRPQSIRDPLNRTTTYGYDERGWLNTMTFPDGGALTITRDPAGNGVRRQHSEGPDLQFTYDAYNRLITANDIAFTRDKEGRITATADGAVQFTAGYDDAGRLETAGYHNAFTVTYTYDVGENGTGLLTGVSDTLTGTQITFAYDGDRRLTTTGLPNGKAIINTWDKADRLTRIQSGDHVDMSFSYDASGRITGVDATVPLSAASQLTPGTDTLTFDAASQINTTGYSHDSRGRMTAGSGRNYTWDGASRLTGVNGTTLAYNGLGDIRMRTEGGATTHFYVNHAICLAPVVAEKDETAGSFLRYYVYTPAGRLLYMIDAANGNKVYLYHFDQTGNTLALTDAAGAVTDAWAYDPHGRVLARTGTHPQPFTFVGAWGVRQEGSDGTLYQMRARWYDAVTGRFISPEPIWPELLTPKAINPYQYAEGDPIRFSDPQGLGSFDTIHTYNANQKEWSEGEPAQPEVITPVHVEGGYGQDHWADWVRRDVETAIVKKSANGRFSVMASERKKEIQKERERNRRVGKREYVQKKFAEPLFVNVSEEGDNVVVLIVDRSGSVPIVQDMFEINKEALEAGEPQADFTLREKALGSKVKRVQETNKTAEAFADKVARSVERIVHSR